MQENLQMKQTTAHVFSENGINCLDVLIFGNRLNEITVQHVILQICECSSMSYSIDVPLHMTMTMENVDIYDNRIPQSGASAW